MSVSPLRGGMNKKSGHCTSPCLWNRKIFVCFKEPQKHNWAIYWGLAAKLSQGLLVPGWAGCAKEKAQCDPITKSLEKMIFSPHRTLLDFIWPFSTNQINISEQGNQSMHKTFPITVLKEGNAQEKAFSISEQVLCHKGEYTAMCGGSVPLPNITKLLSANPFQGVRWQKSLLQVICRHSVPHLKHWDMLGWLCSLARHLLLSEILSFI